MRHTVEIRSATLFTKLPDEFSREPSSAEWLRVQKRGQQLGCFLEGPCFDAQGHLYFTDIPFGRIFRADPDGSVVLIHEYDGEPNGLKVLGDGTLLIADHKNGLMRYTLKTDSMETFLDRPFLERFRGVNDLFIAANGDLFFTDQGQSGLQKADGRLFQYTASGRLLCLMDNLPSPNGVVVTEDMSAVLVSMTRANSIWKMPIREEGRVSKVAAYINLSGGYGPDGMALDVGGNLVICHPGLGVAWVYDADGELMIRVEVPHGKVVTNCAFGGTDGRTLYMTEATTGSIFMTELPLPGIDLLANAAKRFPS